MLIIISISFTALVVGLILLGNTRAARMHRYAKRNHATFNMHRNSLTTPLSAGKLELLKEYFPLFRHVMTFMDNTAFMRLADAEIYKDESPNAQPVNITLFAAEFRNRSFPILKIAPLGSPFYASQYMTVKTNIPEIDRAYHISAPNQAAGLLFTPYLKRLLKTRDNIYLEVNDNAFLYHENCLHRVEELENFHCRAAQLLAEFGNTMVNLDKPGTATIAAAIKNPPKPKPVLTDEEFDAKAQAMLSVMCPKEIARMHGSSSLRGFWSIILLVLLLAIPVVGWLLLKNFPH